ncbi:MAG: response regulator [Gammaproteobacteria bacterium]|nr:MAG: response regulator [Gammaproteobacteria bacterium]
MASEKLSESKPQVLRVMLVDDEELVSRFLEILLNNYGCKVTVFNDSTQALKKFAAHPEAYEAVISDVRMPRLSGDQLAEKILSIKPDIPIALISGYSPDIDIAHLKQLGVSCFLNKPVENKKLMQIIDEFRQRIHPE